MSLDDTIKDDIRTLLRRVADATPGFQPIPGQRKMIAAVANVLARTNEDQKKSLLVIEAGTGTGKTNGYLIPALPIARALKKRIVVSSATVALQEQIIQRDLPAIAAHFDAGLTYALIKGRGRYVCENRLAAAAGSADEGGADALWEETPEAADHELLAQLADDLRSGKWSGDRDELTETVPERVWYRIRNSQDTCVGRTCPNRARCGYFAARDKAKQADVLVANHDLVLANLRAEQGSLFGNPADFIAIFDEAHHLPKVGIEQFACEHQVRGPKRWLRRLATLLGNAPAGDDTTGQRIVDCADALEGALEQLRQVVEALSTFGAAADIDSVLHQFKHGALPSAIADAGGAVAGYAKSLQQALAAYLDAEAEGAEDGVTEAEQRRLSELQLLQSRVANIIEVWSLMLMERPPNVPPVAKWVEMTRSKGDIEYVVCASPVSAAKVLSRLIFDQFSAVVMASATLTALGNFDFFKMKTGLGAYPETQYLQVETRFNYAEQGKLVVPFLRSNPKSYEEHTREIIDLLPQLIDTQSGSGTLVLFTSKRQLRDVLQSMPAFLTPLILSQEARPKAELLRIHAKRVAQGWASVIFGLSSFSEGVDLPGALCTHVIITKLPFSPPDNPIERAMADWIESRGGSPFDQITVPETAVRLVQGAGRLIRRETDYGAVTILDKRIATTSYGRRMLAALPPFSRSIFEKAA